MNIKHLKLYGSVAATLSWLLLAPLLQADEKSISEADQKVTLAKRPPIAFKPFPLVDPISGKPVAPNATIIVEGASLKADSYFKQLNDYEQKLNDLGYTLRNKADIETISKADLNMGAILDAAHIQSALNLDYDSKIMQPVKEVKDLLNDVNTPALDWEDKVLRGFESLASSNDPKGFQAKLTKLDEKVVKTPQLPTLSGNTHKEWGFGPDNKDQMYIAGKAIFHLGAQKTEAEGLATARMDGKILSQEFNLFYGHISANGKLAYSKQDATSNLSAEVYFNSLGRERFKWSKSTSKSTKLADLVPKGILPADKPATPAPAADPGSGTSTQAAANVAAQEESTSVSEWLAVTRESLKMEPWKYGTEKSWIWYFMVGPVPGNGEIGIDGHAYVDWGSGINVSGARANLAFGAQSSVWAAGAIGVEVLRAGVYGKVLLIDASFNFEGSSVFRLGDGALAGDPQEALQTAYKEKMVLEPQIVSEIKGIRTLTFLKGNIGAFAEIPVPTAEPPFWEKKRYTYELFNWDGYTKQGVIFSFKKVNSLGSYNVFGTQSKEDTSSAELDKKLDDHFNGIIEDTGHPGVIDRGNQLLKQNDSTLTEFAAFIKTI